MFINTDFYEISQTDFDNNNLESIIPGQIEIRSNCPWKLFVNGDQSEIISKELISIGNLNSSIVHPREVYKYAIKKSAASVLFIHNHPSGNPDPSKNDKNITKRLTEVGEIIGINVIDHIIIGNNRYFSFKENNLI